MKKIFCVSVLIFVLLFCNGCLKRDDLEDATIYTTIYPIEFLTDTLYGYNSTIKNIYPDGVNVEEYSLTSKQINDYSKGEIFVYNGLSTEKEIARSFININKNLKIIDVSYGLKYTYGVEELWLSPNNYLMLATTIKNNLQSFMTSKYIKEEIENNYINDLEDKLSTMDAELRSLGSIASDAKRNTLVVSSNLFNFLANYGFNIINLSDEDSLSKNAINTLKNNFKTETYKYIFVKPDEEISELIEELVAEGAQIIKFNLLTNLSDEERKSGENYFTIMNANIDYIKSATIEK